MQGTTYLDHFIAAIELEATSPDYDFVSAYPAFDLSRIQNYYPLQPAEVLGKFPADVFSKNVIEIDWSIDQGSHTFYASVPSGGPPVSSKYCVRGCRDVTHSDTFY